MRVYVYSCVLEIERRIEAHWCMRKIGDYQMPISTASSLGGDRFSSKHKCTHETIYKFVVNS